MIEVLVFLLGGQVVLSCATLTKKCPAARLSRICSLIHLRGANLLRELILHLPRDRKVLVLALQVRDGGVVCTDDFARMLLLLLESIGRDHCPGWLLFLLLFWQWVIVCAEDHTSAHIFCIVICAEHKAFTLLRCLCFLYVSRRCYFCSVTELGGDLRSCFCCCLRDGLRRHNGSVLEPSTGRCGSCRCRNSHGISICELCTPWRPIIIRRTTSSCVYFRLFGSRGSSCSLWLSGCLWFLS